MARKKASPADDGSPSDPARLHVWQIQAVRDVLFVAAVFAIVWAGYVLSAVTVPLLVALLLAYLFEPLIDRLSKRPHMNRVRAVAALLATVGLGVLLILALVIPLIVGQTIQLAHHIADGGLRQRASELTQSHVPQTWRENAMTLIDMLPEGDGAGAPAPDRREGEGEDAAGEPAPDAGVSAMSAAELDALIGRKVDEKLAAAQSGRADAPAGDAGWGRLTRGFNAVREGMAVIFGLLGNIVQFGLVAFLIPFYFFFFSLSYPAVVRFGRGLIPEKNKRRTLDLLDKMDRVVSGFVRGRIVISLIMGLMLAVGWMICGVPYAMPLGFIVGIFCAVPYLGAIGVPVAISFLFFSELGVAHDSTLWWAWVIVWPAAVYIVVQLIEAYALTPMIAGKITNLDPVTIIVAVLAGGSVMGVYGMILAIPLAACGKILLTEVLLPRVRRWTEGKAADPLPIDRD